MLYDAEQAYLDAKQRYEWYRDTYIPYEDDKERVRDRVGTANGRDGCRRGLSENCQGRIRRGGGDGGGVGLSINMLLWACGLFLCVTQITRITQFFVSLPFEFNMEREGILCNTNRHLMR